MFICDHPRRVTINWSLLCKRNFPTCNELTVVASRKRSQIPAWRHFYIIFGFYLLSKPRHKIRSSTMRNQQKTLWEDILHRRIPNAISQWRVSCTWGDHSSKRWLVVTMSHWNRWYEYDRWEVLYLLYLYFKYIKANVVVAIE